MKKLFPASLLALSLIVVGTSIVSGAGTASADRDTATHYEESHHQEDHTHDIERDVVELDNGVQITLTTDDADALDRLIDRFTNEDFGDKGPEDVTHSVSILENGFVLTITSDNADSIEQIQSHAAEGPSERGPKGDHGGNDEANGERPNFEAIERTVTELDNGVQITLTTDDADALEHLLDRADREQPEDAPGDIEHSVTTLDNGIQITITSDNPDTVEQIQDRAEEGPRGPRGPHHDDTEENES